MAISFRSAGAVGTTLTTTITLSAPSGIQATDVVLAVIYADMGTGTITPPSGWTLVTRVDDGTTQNMAVYRALGNVASYVFTIPDPANLGVGFTLGYIGVNNTTPMDVAASGQINASSTTGTAPSVTTVTDNAWGVCFFGFASLSVSTFTDAAPLVHRQNGDQLDGADFPKAVAGATGTKTTSINTSAATNIGVTVALRPAPTGITLVTGFGEVNATGFAPAISTVGTASAALGGTIISATTETDIVTGGKTIIITLTSTQWVP